MIRKAATKVMFMAAITLTSGALVVNCSKGTSQDKETLGSVGLALTLPGGATINTVNYTITGGTLPPAGLMGSIDVSPPGATATALVSGLQATPVTGTQYSVTMTATTSTNAGAHLLVSGVGSGGDASVVKYDFVRADPKATMVQPERVSQVWTAKGSLPALLGGN